MKMIFNLLALIPFCLFKCSYFLPHWENLECEVHIIILVCYPSGVLGKSS